MEFNENYFGHKVPVTTRPASEPIQKGQELERHPLPVKSHVQVEEEEEEKSEQKASLSFSFIILCHVNASK